MKNTSSEKWETNLYRCIELNKEGVITVAEYGDKNLNKVIYGDSTPLDFAFHFGHHNALWDLMDCGATRFHRSYSSQTDGQDIKAISVGYKGVRNGQVDGMAEDALTYFTAIRNHFWMQKLLTEGVTPYAIKGEFTSSSRRSIPSGYSAMKFAIDNGDSQGVSLLLNHGFSIDRQLEGMSLEQYAMNSKKEDIQALIMSKRAKEATQSLLDEIIKPFPKP